MCKSTDVTPTSTPKWWDVVISTLFFWRLECQNGPDSPGAHVYIGVRTLTWKADYWKELLEPVFTMWGGCVPDSESLPTLKNIIWPPWSRASARLDSSCTPWVICEWWEWQITVHFPWLWLILRVKVFLCCYRSGGLLKPSINAPLSLVVERDRHGYFFSYGYWNEGMGVFQVEMDSLGCKPIF